MRLNFSALIALATLSIALPVFAEKKPMPISDVIKGSFHRQRVLIQGKVTKRMDWETVVLNDQTEPMLIDVQRVRQEFQVGDQLVIYGLYLGRANQPAARGKLEAIEIAQVSNDVESKKIIEKYGKEPTPVPTVAPAVGAVPVPAATPHNVESRLKELEDLKSKGLVNDEEYKEQRKKILSDL